MLNFDDIVKKELYFDNQLVEGGADKKFRSLLEKVSVLVATEKPIKEIKKFILSQDVDSNLKENLLKTFTQQQKIILGQEKSFSLSQEGMAGLTFTEAIKEHKHATNLKAVRFMAQAREIFKSGESLKVFVENEVKNYIRTNETFWKTETKVAREYAYKTRDKSFDDIRGWMSVSILDRRTSPVCVGLHNMFYSIKEYRDRSEVPNIPPRHPRCRSILLTVRGGNNITEYKGQNIDTFMRRHPKTAEDFMGKEKYKMWAGGKAKIDKYIDIEGKRFYTNDEIISRLGKKT